MNARERAQKCVNEIYELVAAGEAALKGEGVYDYKCAVRAILRHPLYADVRKTYSTWWHLPRTPGERVVSEFRIVVAAGEHNVEIAGGLTERGDPSRARVFYWDDDGVEELRDVDEAALLVYCAWNIRNWLIRDLY